jgi:hypothetical protein
MLTSFQRSMFIQQLRDKHTQWQLPETKEIYFKNFKTAPQEWAPSFGIERDSNGYFYLSDNLFAYCNLRNGLIVRMRKNWKETDWQCYTELYQLSKQTGEFRVDVPLYREVFNVGGSNWEYAELKSPLGDYGKNFNDDVFEWPELTNGLKPNASITDEYRQQVAQYHKDFVDQALIVLKYAVQVSEKYNVGLPINLCRPSTRYKDQNGYFWSDFDQDQWNTEKHNALEYFLNIFAGTLYFALACGVIDENKLNETLEYAREKWTTI